MKKMIFVLSVLFTACSEKQAESICPSATDLPVLKMNYGVATISNSPNATLNLKVLTNVDWKIDVESCSDWLSVDKSEGSGCSDVQFKTKQKLPDGMQGREVSVLLFSPTHGDLDTRIIIRQLDSLVNK